MSRIIIYIVILTLSMVPQVFAQVTFEMRVKMIAQNIEKITTEEKEALKKEVEDINQQLERGSLTSAQAQEAKEKLAAQRAKNIEERTALEEQKLTALIKDKVDGKIKLNEDSISFGKNRISIKWERDSDYSKKKFTDPGEKRTTSQFVFALGVNNLLTDGDLGSLDNSDYRFWGSRFYEWGVTWNTRIFKNDNLLHAKYGFSVIYNNLRPTQNRYFVKDGNQTLLETANVNLNESRFRNVQLVLPFHLEFDLTPKEVNEDGSYRFRTHEHIRFGIGGYTGLNFKTKQILRYREDDILVRTKERGDFNASNFVYGLSAYLGCGPISLYAKYDLNPLFKNNPIEQNNVSFGLRFDFN
ncbi:MAG: hypothetical protein ACK4FS_03480 [Flavobacterium sp.]